MLQVSVRVLSVSFFFWYFWHCKFDKLLTKVCFAYLGNFTLLNLERGADLGRSRFVHNIIQEGSGGKSERITPHFLLMQKDFENK